MSDVAVHDLHDSHVLGLFVSQLFRTFSLNVFLFSLSPLNPGSFRGFFFMSVTSLSQVQF